MQIESVELTEKRLDKARLRGLRRLAALRKAAGPWLNSRTVCKQLGLTSETIRQKVQRKQLLALPGSDSEYVFPALQFHNKKMLPGVKEVLQQLNTDSPLIALSFFLSRSSSFDNKQAIDALKSRLIDEVLTEARSFLL